MFVCTKITAIERVTTLCELINLSGCSVLETIISKLASFPLSCSRHCGICKDIVSRLYLLKTSATSLVMVVSAITPMAGLHPKSKIKFSRFTKPWAIVVPRLFSVEPVFSSSYSVLIFLIVASIPFLKVIKVKMICAELRVK